MLIQNPNMPKIGIGRKFKTLEEYLNYIDKSISWKSEGFEWYCKFSPIMFYIDENKKYYKVEGPHIIELCNMLINGKCDQGQKIIFKSTEADWKLDISLNTFQKLKDIIITWNKLIENKINSQHLNTVVMKNYYRRKRSKRIDKINIFISIILIIFILCVIIYYL